jgi:hypothetical protein
MRQQTQVQSMPPFLSIKFTMRSRRISVHTEASVEVRVTVRLRFGQF